MFVVYIVFFLQQPKWTKTHTIYYFSHYLLVIIVAGRLTQSQGEETIFCFLTGLSSSVANTLNPIHGSSPIQNQKYTLSHLMPISANWDSYYHCLSHTVSELGSWLLLLVVWIWWPGSLSLWHIGSDLTHQKILLVWFIAIYLLVHGQHLTHSFIFEISIQLFLQRWDCNSTAMVGFFGVVFVLFCF